MFCEVTMAGLYIKPASDVSEVDRPVTQSLGISTYITVCLYPQSDPMWTNSSWPVNPELVLKPEFVQHKTLTVFTSLACGIGAIFRLWTVIHATLNATYRYHMGVCSPTFNRLGSSKVSCLIHDSLDTEAFSISSGTILRFNVPPDPHGSTSACYWDSLEFLGSLLPNVILFGKFSF